VILFKAKLTEKILQGENAMGRPTITARERVEFAIRFAQMDLDTLRPGDWLNLRDDFALFLVCKAGQRRPLAQRGEIMTMPLAHPLPSEFSEDDFRALQMEVRVIVQSLVHEGLLSAPMTEIHGYFFLFRPSTGDWSVLTAQGATRDMCLVTLLFLLNQESLDRIRRCPECGTIFYRIQKQQYCSRSCTNRANVRTWRQREEVKSQEQEKAHERYKAKRTAGGSRNTKVERRPRKQLST